MEVATITGHKDADAEEIRNPRHDGFTERYIVVVPETGESIMFVLRLLFLTPGHCAGILDNTGPVKSVENKPGRSRRPEKRLAREVASKNQKENYQGC